MRVLDMILSLFIVAVGSIFLVLAVIKHAWPEACFWQLMLISNKVQDWKMEWRDANPS